MCGFRRYLLIEDSGDSLVIDRLIEEFGDVFDIVQNTKRMGQLFSIDKAYSMVRFLQYCNVMVTTVICP